MKKIKKDITIRFIPNILSEEGRVLKFFKYNRDWTIRRYLKKSGFEFKDMQIIVNAKGVKNLRQHLTIGDEIVIAPSIEDPISAAIGAFAGWFVSLGTVAQIMFIAGVASMAYSIYSALTTKVKAPSFDVTGESIGSGYPIFSKVGV